MATDFTKCYILLHPKYYLCYIYNVNITLNTKPNTKAISNMRVLLSFLECTAISRYQEKCVHLKYSCNSLIINLTIESVFLKGNEVFVRLIKSYVRNSLDYINIAYDKWHNTWSFNALLNCNCPG